MPSQSTGSGPSPEGVAFDARWNLPPRPSAAEPIFVLGAGWRSGSTLLQRLICSSRETLLWGEPYGRAGWLTSMATSARVVSDEWPTDQHFPPDEVFENLPAHWIANVFPPALALREAHAAFLDRLLAEPARARGFPRFGLKEVRLGAEEVRYLHWIYPDCRFVFLVRNPWDAWSSARGGRWWKRWPDVSVRDAHTFADHWRRLACSFMDWPQENACLIRYEDLCDPDFELEALAQHCRLGPLDGSVRRQVERGMARPPVELPTAEVDLIYRMLGEAASTLGYDGPGDTQSLLGPPELAPSEQVG